MRRSEVLLFNLETKSSFLKTRYGKKNEKFKNCYLGREISWRCSLITVDTVHKPQTVYYVNP